MDGLGGEASSRLSAGGHQPAASQQVLTELASVSDGEEESEGANPATHEGNSHTHYIAIQRNSRYYRSMRLPNRSKRKTTREAMHRGHAAGEYPEQHHTSFCSEIRAVGTREVRKGTGKIESRPSGQHTIEHP